MDLNIPHSGFCGGLPQPIPLFTLFTYTPTVNLEFPVHLTCTFFALREEGAVPAETP